MDQRAPVFFFIDTSFRINIVGCFNLSSPFPKWCTVCGTLVDTLPSWTLIKWLTDSIHSMAIFRVWKQSKQTHQSNEIDNEQYFGANYCYELHATLHTLSVHSAISSNAYNNPVRSSNATPQMHRHPSHCLLSGEIFFSTERFLD